MIVLSRGLIPEGRAASAARHFDATGALLVTGGLTALVYGIVRTDTLGWGSTGVIAPLALGAVLLAAFVFVEGRLAQAPLMPLRMFAMARLRAANLIMFLLYAAVFAIWFFLSLYLQQVLHYDPLQTGLRFLPMTLAIIHEHARAAPRRALRRAPRADGRHARGRGRPVPAHRRPQRRQLRRGRAPRRAAGRDRDGTGARPGDDRRRRGRARRESGLASGMLNTSRLIGGALGLAVLSTVAASRTHVSPGVGRAQALTDGFTVAFTVGAAITLLGAAIALAFLRAPPGRRGEHDRIERR